MPEKPAHAVAPVFVLCERAPRGFGCSRLSQPRSAPRVVTHRHDRAANLDPGGVWRGGTPAPGPRSRSDEANCRAQGLTLWPALDARTRSPRSRSAVTTVVAVRSPGSWRIPRAFSRRGIRERACRARSRHRPASSPPESCRRRASHARIGQPRPESAPATHGAPAARARLTPDETGGPRDVTPPGGSPRGRPPRSPSRRSSRPAAPARRPRRGPAAPRPSTHAARGARTALPARPGTGPDTNTASIGKRMNIMWIPLLRRQPEAVARR